MTSTPAVAFPGTDRMGLPMAMHLRDDRGDTFADVPASGSERTGTP
jgi:hypothetical protein